MERKAWEGRRNDKRARKGGREEGKARKGGREGRGWITGRDEAQESEKTDIVGGWVVVVKRGKRRNQGGQCRE